MFSSCDLLRTFCFVDERDEKMPRGEKTRLLLSTVCVASLVVFLYDILHEFLHYSTQTHLPVVVSAASLALHTGNMQVQLTSRRGFCITFYTLKPNSITLTSSELAPNMFGASSELVRTSELAPNQLV